jgi:hypothetical protein
MIPPIDVSCLFVLNILADPECTPIVALTSCSALSPIHDHINPESLEEEELLDAILTGNEDKIGSLMRRRGVNPSAQTKGNALGAAVRSGYKWTVEFMLEEGADVNFEIGAHGTALRAAIYGGNEHLIGLLLDNNADGNSRGGKYSAFKMAISRGWTDKRMYRVLRFPGYNTSY